MTTGFRTKNLKLVVVLKDPPNNVVSKDPGWMEMSETKSSRSYLGYTTTTSTGSLVRTLYGRT